MRAGSNDEWIQRYDTITPAGGTRELELFLEGDYIDHLDAYQTDLLARIDGIP